MGRQIRFFMIGNDEKKFFEVIEAFGDLIVDKKGKSLEISKLKEILLQEEEKKVLSTLNKFFITFNESKLIKDENGFIEPFESDVIDFSRCSIEGGNMVWQGRIWAEFNYYDNNGVLVKKEKWFEQKFNMYRSWIKKNFRISVDKFAYIGEEAYKLYKEKGYRMMNSPKVEIEF
jgi:hypothetical protein